MAPSSPLRLLLAPRALLLLLALLGPLAHGAYTCTTRADCENLGTCLGGRCVCLPGFTGPSCGSVSLAPASRSFARVWPAAAPASVNASAWGITAVFDPSDGLYHAFITVACGEDGVVGSGGGESFVAHVASAQADRGFEFVGMVTPQTSFGPHVAVTPDGSTFVLVFRVNELLANASICLGNASSPQPPAFGRTSYIPASSLVSGDPEGGTNIYVAWAKAMRGPWSVARLNITGAGDVHKSNPSLAFLRDGRVLLGYRYNEPKVGELNAFAFAANNDFRGPYECVCNLTAGRPGDEDPFVWEQPDGTLHALYHNGPYGYHAFAVDEQGAGGRAWAVSPSGAHAFTLDVSYDDGTSEALRRRERPELTFGASGAPVALLNGVQASDGGCYAFRQGVAPAL
jgi:hypothetical protein